MDPECSTCSMFFHKQRGGLVVMVNCRRIAGDAIIWWGGLQPKWWPLGQPSGRHQIPHQLIPNPESNRIDLIQFPRKFNSNRIDWIKLLNSIFRHSNRFDSIHFNSFWFYLAFLYNVFFFLSFFILLPWYSKSKILGIQAKCLFISNECE